MHEEEKDVMEDGLARAEEVLRSVMAAAEEEETARVRADAMAICARVLVEKGARGGGVAEDVVEEAMRLMAGAKEGGSGFTCNVMETSERHAPVLLGVFADSAARLETSEGGTERWVRGISGAK